MKWITVTVTAGAMMIYRLIKYGKNKPDGSGLKQLEVNEKWLAAHVVLILVFTAFSLWVCLYDGFKNDSLTFLICAALGILIGSTLYDTLTSRSRYIFYSRNEVVMDEHSFNPRTIKNIQSGGMAKKATVSFRNGPSFTLTSDQEKALRSVLEELGIRTGLK